MLNAANIMRYISFLLAAPLLLSVSCKTKPLSEMVIGPDYAVRNYFRHNELAKVRRIAVLPIATDSTDHVSVAGQTDLYPLLLSELAKTKSFEIIPVSKEKLLEWTGRATLSADQKLPPALFQALRDQGGCDAVFFPKLTLYKPYPPIVIGWNFKIISLIEPKTLWSVDELFDSGFGPIINSARRYYQLQMEQAKVLSDSTTVLASPRRFAQYTLHASFSTLAETPL